MVNFIWPQFYSVSPKLALRSLVAAFGSRSARAEIQNYLSKYRTLGFSDVRSKWENISCVNGKRETSRVLQELVAGNSGTGFTWLRVPSLPSGVF